MLRSFYAVFLLVVAVSVGDGLIIDQLKGFLSGRSQGITNNVDYINKYGYPSEIHTVTTDDGYLLTVHRIPGSPRAPSSGVKTPVLLQHGLGSISDTWVLMGPGKSLALLLADQGYDVWLGNARGNTHSHKHVSMSSSDSAYSNYTWHEMGVYDLPAVIDHILMTTNHQQLFYIGHSMGTTMFFVLTTMRPEYNDKIRLMVAMAPAVFIWKPTSFVIPVFQLTHSLYLASLQTRLGWLNGAMALSMGGMLRLLCSDRNPFQQVCIDLYHASFGRSEEQLNMTLLPNILTNGASGLNAKLLDHFSQITETERFQMYSEDKNKISTQTEYDLSKVSAPVSIHYAVNDILVPPKGVLHLSERLPKLAKLVRVPDDSVNHIDFLFANNVKTIFYDDVLDIINKY